MKVRYEFTLEPETLGMATEMAQANNRTLPNWFTTMIKQEYAKFKDEKQNDLA